MIDLSSKTYANLLAGQLDRVPNDIDKREMSLIYTALGPTSWLIEGFYMILSQLQQNSFVKTAVGEYLDLKVIEKGITRGAATPATYEGVFDVEIPIGSRFSTISGIDSLVFFASAPMSSNDEYFHYNMVCETPGQTGNGKIGDLLPITFISGLTVARLITLLLSGTDEQDDDSLRQEYFDALQSMPSNGNIASYRSFILAQNNVGAVQVYPAWQGSGTVLCSILDGNYDAATPALVEIIQNLVCPPEDGNTEPSPNGFGIAPVGAIATIGTATPLQVDIDTTVVLSPGVSLASLGPLIVQAVSDYLLSVRRNWGSALVTNVISYPVNVYLAQIIALVLQIAGIINVTGTTLNGGAADLNLTQTGTLQQIPTVGVITVNGQIIYSPDG